VLEIYDYFENLEVKSVSKILKELEVTGWILKTFSTLKFWV
jgi:hypothetical protein